MITVNILAPASVPTGTAFQVEVQVVANPGQRLDVLLSVTSTSAGRKHAGSGTTNPRGEIPFFFPVDAHEPGTLTLVAEAWTPDGQNATTTYHVRVV